MIDWLKEAKRLSAEIHDKIRERRERCGVGVDPDSVAAFKGWMPEATELVLEINALKTRMSAHMVNHADEIIAAVEERDALRARVAELEDGHIALENVLYARCTVGMDDGFASQATLQQYIEWAINQYDQISVGMNEGMVLSALAGVERDTRAALKAEG